MELRKENKITAFFFLSTREKHFLFLSQFVIHAFFLVFIIYLKLNYDLISLKKDVYEPIVLVASINYLFSFGLLQINYHHKLYLFNFVWLINLTSFCFCIFDCVKSKFSCWQEISPFLQCKRRLNR